MSRPKDRFRARNLAAVWRGVVSFLRGFPITDAWNKDWISHCMKVASRVTDGSRSWCQRSTDSYDDRPCTPVAKVAYW